MYKVITKEIVEVMGELVVVNDHSWGKYVGKLNEVRQDFKGITKADVIILAVLEYPSQEALVNYSGIYHRIAYDHGEKLEFDISILMPYKESLEAINDYNKTVIAALEKIILEYTQQYEVFKKITPYAQRKCTYLQDTITFLKHQLKVRREHH